MGDFLDYCAWVVTEFWRGYSAFPLLAFGLTLGLQFARRRMGGRQYRLLWGVLAVVGLVWGGLALWAYVPNFMQWYDAYFLIPAVLLAVGLAKMQEFLPWRAYLWMLVIIVGVIGASHWVVWQYSVRLTPERNPWFGDRLAFDIHEWLAGRGWPGKGVPSGGSGGGAGYAIFSSRGEPTIEWIVYRVWGIPLLVSALAVPAWRMFRSMAEEHAEKGRAARELIEGRVRSEI